MGDKEENEKEIAYLDKGSTAENFDPDVVEEAKNENVWVGSSGSNTSYSLLISLSLYIC